MTLDKDELKRYFKYTFAFKKLKDPKAISHSEEELEKIT
jgi:DNA primase catalytic subunit